MIFEIIYINNQDIPEKRGLLLNLFLTGEAESKLFICII